MQIALFVDDHSCVVAVFYYLFVQEVRFIMKHVFSFC